MKRTVRVAAVGDVHVKESDSDTYRELLADIHEHADVLALCGDITNRGLPREAEVVAEEHLRYRFPVVAVLGNHDVECGQEGEVARILEQSGITMLGEEPCQVLGIGFAGTKGFCGGFDQHVLTSFGEECIKAFVRQASDEALNLEGGLSKLRTEHRIAVLHYAPVRDTVVGEPPEIFPFLGCSRLAEPLDRYRVTAVVHGHAHRGAHSGKTPSGIPVYNVAHAVMEIVDSEHPFLVLTFDDVEAQ